MHSLLILAIPGGNLFWGCIFKDAFRLSIMSPERHLTDSYFPKKYVEQASEGVMQKAFHSGDGERGLGGRVANIV